MLKSYLKLFLRNLRRQPVYTLLNLSCLAIGMAAAIFILLYLDFEMNYDRVHQKGEQIYRVNTTAIKTHERTIDVAWQRSPANFGALVQQDYPEVESFVRFFSFYSNAVRFEYRQQTIEMEPEQVIAADSNVFQLFTFELLRGDPADALNGPNKIVLSETLADRIFGTDDPVGQVLDTRLVHSLTNGEADYPLEVTGVYRDLPPNTHLLVHAMISAETDEELNNYYFGRFNVHTYLLLKDRVDPEALTAKLTAIYDRYLDPALDPVLVNVTHELVPLYKIHLSETGGTTYLLIFSGIGFLLLLIAFFGYINLVTAQAGRRALEIGLRKVLGSERRQLITQFMAESLFFTILSLTVAVGLVTLLAGPVNRLLELQVDIAQLWQARPLMIMLGGILLLGLAGGSYPAFFLSSFQPVKVLKGKLHRSAPLHKYLVGFQFAVVIFVLTSTGMIYQQLEYLKRKDLGFAQDQILQLDLAGQEGLDKVQVFKESLRKDPNILSVASCSFIPGVGGMVRQPASAEGSEPQFIHHGRIDYDYLETMDIDLVAGRNFSPDFPADSATNVLVNKTFVRHFELGDNPLEKQVRLGGWGNPNSLRIIGVVEDFHQSSLHAAIEPQMFRLRPRSNDLMVKVAEDPTAALTRIEATWRELFPEEAFHYRFLDEVLLERYREDQKRGSIFLFFSLVTLLIAFAGLYGLAAYLTTQRTREVGIRKVLGAGIPNIILLFTRDFLLLAVIAAVPGLILAWYTIRQWLENFAFRTPMNYLLFILVLLSVLLLTFVTVGWHAARAASLNPKETLRNG